MTIKDYLENSLQTNGPEPPRPRKGKKSKYYGPPRNARRAFREMNHRINEGTYGNRANVPNICLLLVNEKKTSRFLKRCGIDRFCDHIIVFSGEDEVDLATIRKKICPEAEIIRGSNL